MMHTVALWSSIVLFLLQASRSKKAKSKVVHSRRKEYLKKIDQIKSKFFESDFLIYILNGRTNREVIS